MEALVEVPRRKREEEGTEEKEREGEREIIARLGRSVRFLCSYGRYNDKSLVTTFNSSLLSLQADRYHLSVILAVRIEPVVRPNRKHSAIKATRQIRMSRSGREACFEVS